MQAIFRLPWSTEQMKLSEKARLDKMRPSPVLDIPVLNQLKRKRSDAAATPTTRQQSPSKKQRLDTECPQQLPTPSSPQAAARTIQAAPANQLAAHRDSTAALVADAAPSSEAASTNAIIMEADKDMQVRGGETVVKQHDALPSVLLQQNAALQSATGNMADAQASPATRTTLTPLQQVIENEFNMQILMKHNELRLIEQELGKCQIALEQLRRCELRPYPGSSQPDFGVSQGSGFAVYPPPGFSRPTHPAPFGVTDGPYSRHYRQWLLQDPQFESVSPQALAQAETLANAPSRSNRGSGHVRKPTSKSISVSTRGSDALQSIPNYPAPASKDKSAPCILKRSTDNQLVKLICKDCKRGNFSSIQGFLNHCRIAHKVDYKSHDAAAIDCGQLLDDGELANVPAETQAAPPAKPTHSRAASSVGHSHRNSNSSLVHPMNTNTALDMPVANSRTAPSTPVAPATGMSCVFNSSKRSPFKASAHVPRLSAHFSKHNVGGDLEQAITSAKQKVDLSGEDDLQAPDTPDARSPVVPFGGATRMPARAPSTDSSASRKGFRQPAQRSRPPPLAPAPPNAAFNASNLSSPQELASATLSPHADSNPGLVSDHEDDDHGSASDGESSAIDVAPAQRLPAGRSCEDHMDIDVQEDDEIDQHGVIIRRNSMVANDARAMRPAGSPSRKLGGK